MKTDVKEIRLQVWEEVIGKCVKFETKKDLAVVILRICGRRVRMVYTRDSQEGIILKRFGRNLVGQKIGILRTDIPAKPIIVRIMPKKNSTS